MSETDPRSRNGGIAPSWFDQPGMSQHHGADQATHTTVGHGGPPQTTGDALPAHLIGRTSITLLAVIGVILICAWALKRLGFQRDRVGQSLPVIASRSLGQRERVVIVEVEEEWLVLGVTPHNITTLHRRPAPADRPHPDEPTSRKPNTRPSFGQALADNMARLTGRHSR